MFSCERGVEMAQKEKSGVLYGSLLEHFPSKHHITHSGECIDFSTISPCDDSRDISATATLRFRTLSYSLSTARISSVHDLVLAGAFTERCWTTKKGELLANITTSCLFDAIPTNLEAVTCVFFTSWTQRSSSRLSHGQRCSQCLLKWFSAS